MRVDEAKIAEALRVTFAPRSSTAAFAADARHILGILDRKESREALIEDLAKIQMRASETVIHLDCANLADKLLKATDAPRT